MYGTIEKITAYPAKGEMGESLMEGRFIEDLGLEGDFHARGGERQISLRCAELSAEGLCLARFAENISIRGLTASDLRPGVRLSCEEAVLEITGETKHCHEECQLFESGKSCPLAGLNLFARVAKSGFIRVGERVCLSPGTSQ